MSSKQAKPAQSRLATCRKAFRNSCAMALALVLAGNGGIARAQAVFGTVDVVNGATVTRNDISTQTEIGIFSDQTVLNWNLPSSSASTAPEEYVRAGTELMFADFRSSATTTFTVLNRILPYDTVSGVAVNRAVQFNGTVSSVSGGAPSGEIWFFSPSGIIISPTASFNVGSLVLTTNDIDTTGGLYGTGGEIRFRGAASSLAAVEIQSGAVIDAAASAGAYVAIVAPRIVQAGTVGADGQVALVAAEQADITINTGLLNIVVTQGTTDANGIVHTGSTGGAASTGSGDVQVLSLIAIPKNTALTMLLSGSIGYTPAVSAFDDGSSVILSAGHGANLSNAELAQNLGNIEIGNSQFTSDVSGVATNAINIAPSGGSVEFEQGGSFTGFRSVSAISEDGESIVSGQSLYLRSNQGSTGGSVTIRAEGGLFGGDINAVSLFAAANGASDGLFPESGEGVPATGGTVTLQASGGRITADMIGLEALGQGLSGTDTGGTGTGGTVIASVSGGGAITANSFDASATGYGGEGALNGGDGIGGSVSLLEQGGTLALGFVTLSARGVGESFSAQTGDGQGGSARIDITSGTTTWSDLFVETDAESELYFFDGVSGSATGRADAISLHVGSGATLDITGYAGLTADAYADVRGAGNFGRAGGISVLADSGGTLRVGNTLIVSANATTSRESQYAFPDSSPALTGGTVNVLANGGTIDVHQLRASANAIGTGATGTGGIVTGGTAIVGAANGGTISTFAFDAPGFLSVEAEAYGGNGPAPSNAFGGTATLFAEDGTLNFDSDVLVSAVATSGYRTETTSGTGFSAQGGSASIELRAGSAGTASLSAVGISILADGNATGTDGFSMLSGNGGSGTGGSARLTVAAGTLNADFVTIRADGLGGVSAPLDVSVPLQSGDGFGGAASLVATGGSTTITGSLDLLARGFGGDKDLLSGGGGNDTLIGAGSLAGNGTGGTAEMQLSGGAVTTANLMLDGSGVGAAGTDNFSGMTNVTDGGSGTGGSARVVMANGSTASLIADDVLVVANGLGGRGGTDGFTSAGGGNGSAGSAGFSLADGSFTLGATSVQADGIGGDGATGGNGVGGVASFALNDSVGGTAPRSLASLSLTANGIGGTSNTGPAATETAGQAQLTSNAGSAAGAVSVAGDFLAAAQGSVAPAGYGFVGNIGGGAFVVGGNSTITTTRDVSLTIGAGGQFTTTGMLSIFTSRTVSSSGLVSSGGDATISANLGILMSDLNTGGAAYLVASSGSVTLSNDLRSTGLVSVLGTSVDISSLGSLSFYDATATTGDISIQTAGDLQLPTIAAPGNVTLASTGGALVMSGPISGVDISLSSAADLTSFTVAASGALSLTSTAGSVITPTALDATAIAISAAGSIDTLDMTATGAVSLYSGGTINVGGTITGADITATSGDMVISSAGSIGALGTTRTVTLRNANAGTSTFIGGAVQTAGYQVDATELRQLFADNSITLGAADGPAGSGADLIIGDLSLAYGTNGNIGTGGTLKMVAPGRVEVSGAVALTTSSDADRFSIDPTRIDIITDTGSIVMKGSTGNLQGELELVGGTIAVASRATLAQIANLTSQASINEVLSAAPAVPNPDGYLQASSIVVDAANAIYIANTGATSDYADRRGFTANRLSITTGSASTHVSINGVIVDTAGLTVTGRDVAPLVSVNGQPATSPGRLSRFSTLNSCPIGTNCEFSQQNELTRSKSDIEVPLDPEGESSSANPEYLYVLEIEQPEPDDLQPLVDEPVTGVGNDDLWGSSCGPDSAGCPQGGNRQ